MTYLGTYDLPATVLRTYPGNPRRGDLPAIRASVRAHGQYRSIVVKPDNPTDPNAGGTVLAGNHTLQAIAAEHDGDTPATVRVEMHDVDDTTARKIVAVDNRTADIGDYDDRLLIELLADLDDLTGTGYDNDDLAALEKAVTAPTLDDLADTYGEDTAGDSGLWPRLSFTMPPVLMAAWRSHLDTHSGDEVQAFAALLDVDPATL